MEASFGFGEASATGLTALVEGAGEVMRTTGADVCGAGRSSVFTQSQVEAYMFTLERLVCQLSP
jgi:hypothetical protein